MTHKFVLIRHGESQWNLENRFTGWTDVDLTANGLEEARRAIESLGGHIVGQSNTSLMACWGRPGSGEDHLRLALTAALRIAGLCGPELQIGCAVETGLAVAGPISSEAGDWHLVGPVLRKAERLQSLAMDILGPSAGAWSLRSISRSSRARPPLTGARARVIAPPI